MKKYITLFIAASLLAACANKDGKSKLDKDKEKLASLKKRDADIRDSIQLMQDTINNEGGKEVKMVRVGTKDVFRQVFRHYVQVQASVYGQDNINVNSEMPGVIKSIFVTEGDKVTKGEVLASIDDAVIQQNMQEIQTNLDLAKTLYEKQKGLWDQKIGTEVQYLSAKSNYESLQKRMSSMQQQDDMTKIKSPIDGTVDAVSIKVGESVAPGLPTIQVVNADELKVKGNVAEAYISDIHPGDSLSILFPDLHDTVISTATYVSRAIDQVNRTFNVEVKLPQNQNYHPNMIAMMNIVDYSNHAAITVPVNVVQSDPTGSFVFIAQKDAKNNWTAVKQMVTTGRVSNGNQEILKGLNAGDKVITVGYEDLNNGDAISL
jgi:membrane fusion protein (multidrug efflux system)